MTFENLLIYSILGLFGMIVLGVLGVAYYYFFIRGSLKVVLCVKVGSEYKPKKRMRVKPGQEEFSYKNKEENGEYIIDGEKVIDGTLYYEIGKPYPLQFDLKSKPNAELLYKVMKTKIYGAIFDDSSITMWNIILIAGILIAVGVSAYSVMGIEELKKETLLNRAILANVTKYLMSGGGGIIIP